MRALLLGLASLVLAGSTANAGIVGTTVTINYLFPNSTTVFGTSAVPVPSSPTMLTCAPHGPGACSAFAEPAFFTITNNSFTVNEDAGSSYTADPFNGIQYADLGVTITGFTLSTNLSGLTAADVSFTAHSIEYNAQGLSFLDAPYFVTLTVTTVPEPTTWAMMMLGFAALGFVGYRASRKVLPAA